MMRTPNHRLFLENTEARERIAGWLASEGAGKFLDMAMRQLMLLNQRSRAATLADSLSWRGAEPNLRKKIAQLLLESGRYSRAVAMGEQLLQDLAGAKEHEKTITTTERVVGLAKLNEESIAFLEGSQPTVADGIRGFVVVYNAASPSLAGLLLPVLHQLQKQRYAVQIASHGSIVLPPTGVEQFDMLGGCIDPKGVSFVDEYVKRPAKQWAIDWQNRTAECEGINFFYYFHERVAQKLRVYSADINASAEAKLVFETLLGQADTALAFCDKLLDLAKAGLPIRVALADSHFAPWGIVRQWCLSRGQEHNIHAVGVGTGYENYFSNLSTKYAKTLAVEDLTAQPEMRTQSLGSAHRFKEYLTAHPEALRPADEEVLSWVKQDRSKTGDSRERYPELAERIQAARTEGSKVFLALGKVSIDFAAPGDKGWAHSDFADWMNHLIKAVAGSDNLLFIKPHPHEIRPEIVARGAQPLRELVPKKLPPNVIFLPHDAYNTHELAPLVDAAFLWNGTASNELPILGVAVYQASIWGERDYPIGLEKLTSRRDYEDVLQGHRAVVLSDDTKKLAAAYLRFMRSDFVGMPYGYVKMAVTNQYSGPPALVREELDKYLRDGDPYVERAAARFFEFDKVANAVH